MPQPVPDPARIVGHQAIATAANGGFDDANPMTGSEPPRWALDQAIEEADEGDEGESIADRAWRLVRAKQQRADEQHDQYDDPDQGGEG